ncbi:hypothetical protein E8E91_02490 [Pseudomonas sp. BN515]|nr:hypothetical protein [Pseudomonas sp. BN515]
MRRIFCRRFEGSISLGNSALSRKSDRGIAESVKPVANGQAGFGTAHLVGLALACGSEFIREWDAQRPLSGLRQDCVLQSRLKSLPQSMALCCCGKPQVRLSPSACANHL